MGEVAISATGNPGSLRNIIGSSKILRIQCLRDPATAGQAIGFQLNSGCPALPSMRCPVSDDVIAGRALAGWAPDVLTAGRWHDQRLRQRRRCALCSVPPGWSLFACCHTILRCRLARTHLGTVHSACACAAFSRCRHSRLTDEVEGLRCHVAGLPPMSAL